MSPGAGHVSDCCGAGSVAVERPWPVPVPRGPRRPGLVRARAPFPHRAGRNTRVSRARERAGYRRFAARHPGRHHAFKTHSRG